MNPMINNLVTGLNSVGAVFCKHAAGVFVQSALLVVVLFIVDLLLRRRIRAVFRYCVWLLVLVKLILPPTLSLPTGIGYWASDRLPSSLNVSGGSFDLPGFEFAGEFPERSYVGPSEGAAEAGPPIAATKAPLPDLTWKAIFFILWLMGVVAFLALLVQRARFVRGLIATSSAGNAEFARMLEECRRQIGVRLKTDLRISETISSPAVCGFFRPIILIPAGLVGKLSPEGLRVILIHELAHIKRADLWVNTIQTFLQVVYFYNPFVWFANSVIRKVCEEAVDETVLVTLGGKAKDYSNTLIDIGEMAFWKADLGLRLIGVAESKKALQWRIRHMLTRPIPKSAKIGAFSTIAILLIAAILLPMARGERSKQKVPAASQETIRGADETVPATAESNVIVDPNTGVKFVLAKTFSGANNVIPHVNKLILSPDARFLTHWGKVIPLDGTETFRYNGGADFVREVAVSPNGRYIAHGGNAVWLQPVSPSTLRPDGPAKKLLDLRGGSLRVSAGGQTALYWTRDSQTVFFQAYDTEGRLQKHAFSAATDAPVSYPDAVSTGLLSPDGKCVALTDTYKGFWVKPIGDGSARMLCENGPAPVCWSRDGHWLIGLQPWGGARFVRYPEGQEYYVPLPKGTRISGTTTGVGLSVDKSRIFFYQTSHKLTHGVWVASADDTALNDMNFGRLSYALGCRQWAPDGKAFFHTARTWTGQWETGLYDSPLSGDGSVRFTLSPALPQGAKNWSVSPDGKWLLFSAARESESNTRDLGLIPLSRADHTVSGPAKVVFRFARQHDLVWSPDSTRVALTSKVNPADEEDIWIVFTDSRAPIRLTRTAEIEQALKWSPDGSMLAFVSDDAGAKELKVIPTAGGDALTIRKWVDMGGPTWGWSPDSKSLTILEQGMLVQQPLSGGEAKPIFSLKEYELTWVGWLAWSPDGSRLALEIHRKYDTKEPLASPYGELLFARVEGGHLQQTGTVDLGSATWTGGHGWSPDGTHVACGYEGYVAVRPEGRLYEVAVDDIVDRIEAGAIPATQPKAAESTTGNTQ